jgi:hypothetical protein
MFGFIIKGIQKIVVKDINSLIDVKTAEYRMRQRIRKPNHPMYAIYQAKITALSDLRELMNGTYHLK